MGRGLCSTGAERFGVANPYEYIVNLSRDFITLIDRDYRYSIVNDSYCSTIERSRDEILGKTVAEVWGERKFEGSIKKRLDQAFAGEEVHYIERFRFGSVDKHMHVSFYPYRAADEERTLEQMEATVSHVLVFSHDISKLAETESRLDVYEHYDPVTGLFNRHSLTEILTKELETARRSRTDALRAVLFVSLKNFKRINQTHGMGIGDILLEHTANRMKECLRSGDIVFRFSGTILVVLLPAIAHTTDAAVVAAKLWETICVPYRHHATVINITAHIGVSVFPVDGHDVETVIRHANSASVEAEEQNAPFLLYDRELHEVSVERISTVSDLQHSFDADQLELHYQPIVTVRDGTATIVGAEALIRWNHPNRGLLMPADFIALAEQSRLIQAIDRWALYQACKEATEWPQDDPIFVTLNISAIDLSDDFLIEVVDGALKGSQRLPPSRLKLELTESQSMENPEASIGRISALSELGVDIWIDDFGSGLSSLSSLKRIPATTMKIDKSFLEGIESSRSERDYLASIVASIMARQKSVIIEGVSSAAQVAILEEIGCPVMQGYYFSRPVPAAVLRALLRQHARLPLTE